jgi:hypothetical protein
VPQSNHCPQRGKSILVLGMRFVVASIAVATLFLVASVISYENDPEVGTLAGFYVVVAIVVLIYVSKTIGVLSYSTASVFFFLWFIGLFPILDGLTQSATHSEAKRHALSYLIALLAMASLGIGFVLGQRMLRDFRGRAVLHDLGFSLFNDWRVNFVFQIAGIAGYIYSIKSGYFFLGVESSSKGALSGVAAIAASWLIICYTSAIYHALNRMSPVRTWRFIALISFIFLTAFGALSLSKYSLLLPLLVPILILAQQRRWVLAMMIFGVSLLLYLLVAPLIGVLRVALAHVEGGREEIMKQLSVEILDMHFAVGRVAGDQSGFVVFGRGIFDYFTYLVNGVGTVFPFLKGNTYFYGAQWLLPFVEKHDTLGYLIARTSGYLSWDDKVTNLSPTIVAEYYINFGVIGVAIGMFLIGIFYVWIDKRLTERKDWTLIYILLFINFNETFLGQSWFGFFKGLLTSSIVFIGMRYLIYWWPRNRIATSQSPLA